MTLYHVTTSKKAKRYRESGAIYKPVRGFDTLSAALLWATKVGRNVVYEVDTKDADVHKLPDHHNAFGDAFWADADIPVSDIKAVRG